MDRILRTRAAAGLCAAAAAVAVWGREWGAALALGTTAAAVLLLATARDVPPHVPDRVAAAAARSQAGLLRELRIQGRGLIFQPPEGPARLFVPADPDVAAWPDNLPERRAVHVATFRGVELVPPGADLLTEWAGMAGPRVRRGSAEAGEDLARAFESLGLGRDVTLAWTERRLSVSYEPDAFVETCRLGREVLAPWDVQGACPACSFAALLVSAAVEKPIQFKSTAAEGVRVTLDLEVVG